MQDLREKLHSKTLVLVCGEVTPVTGDLDVEGASTKKLNLWDLQRDTATLKSQEMSLFWSTNFVGKL